MQAPAVGMRPVDRAGLPNMAGAPEKAPPQPVDTVGLGESQDVLPSPQPTLVPHPMRPPLNPHLRSWGDDIIYFICTDRFRDGDTSNNQDVNRNDPLGWHGGDFQGLINSAAYLRQQGITKVWITPPMKNQAFFYKASGSHGYWPVDEFDTDPHLGSMDKYHEMVRTLHDQGIGLLVDLPLNHVAWEHPLYAEGKHPDWFHTRGDIQNWEDQTEREEGRVFGLPDLAQENPAVRDYLEGVGQFWAGTAPGQERPQNERPVGFRLDAVKNVPYAFWDQFDRKMHESAGPGFQLIGEYFDADPHAVGNLQKADMDGCVDYPLHWTLLDVFAHDRSMMHLAGNLGWYNSVYPHPESMGAFLDNHDTERFLNECGGDKRKLKLALTCLMTINRIPVIFYGTEQSLDNRHTDGPAIIAQGSRNDMDFHRDEDMSQFFQKLTSIRNDCEPLRHGALLEMWQDDQVYAFDRKSDHGEAVVVLNNADATQSRDIPLRAESQLANGTVLQDMLTGEKTTVQDGKIHCEVGGRSARIYLPLP